MVRTPGFHPGNPGSIPLVGEFLFFFLYTYFQSSAQPPDILTFNTVWNVCIFNCLSSLSEM